MLDAHDRQYLEAMESLFEHPGWKILMDEATGWQDAIATKWRSLKPEDLRYEQGRYDGLEQITKFNEMIAMVRQKAAEAETVELFAEALS